MPTIAVIPTIDRVADIGETSFSDTQLTKVIQSWAILATQSRYLGGNDWYGKNDISLGDAFSRTLCADIIRVGSQSEVLYHRVGDTDKDALVSWFLQGEQSPFGRKHVKEVKDLLKVRTFLFGQVGFVDSDILPPAEQTAGIDAAIKLATNRRRFFITEKGLIGLGPATLGIGDSLYVLPGGQTPFMLRGIGLQDNISSAKVIGDCYAHGIMDGETISILGSSVDDAPRVVDLRRRLEAAHGDLRVKLRLWAESKRRTDMRFSRGIVRRQTLTEKKHPVELEEAEQRIIDLAYELSQEREVRFGGFGINGLKTYYYFDKS